MAWKLRGICKDKSNRPSYEGIGVYGNLLGSNVHHLYYGHYGYAQLYSLLSGNKVHDNEVYGFDPHDDSLNLTISDNEVYYNFDHGVIFSKYCHNTRVTHNYVHDNGGVGIFPHYVSDNALIAHNIVEQNGDSGIAFLESSDGLVYNNTLTNNVHGIRFSVGSRNNVVAGNTLEDHQGYDVYQYAGSDPVAEVESASPTANVFYANKFAGNVGGARLDDSVDTQLVANVVGDWAGFEFRDSSNTLIVGNSFLEDMTYSSSSSCFNAASDVSFGDVCSTAAISKPFGQEDLARMINFREGGMVASFDATQAPSDLRSHTSLTSSSGNSSGSGSGSSSGSSSGSDSGSASPTGLWVTAAPTASTSHTPTPTAIQGSGGGITSPDSPTTSSSGGGGDERSLPGSGSGGGGGGEGRGIDSSGGYTGSDTDDDYESSTMSPTPSLGVPGVPVPGVSTTDDDSTADANGGGASSRVIYGVIGGGVCVASAIGFVAM